MTQATATATPTPTPDIETQTDKDTMVDIGTGLDISNLNGHRLQHLNVICRDLMK